MSHGHDPSPGHEPKITLVFVVNGENFPVEANVQAPLAVAVEHALKASDNTGRRDLNEWEVRDSNGVLLEMNRTLAELRLGDGTRLFLNVRVGAGGVHLRCR